MPGEFAQVRFGSCWRVFICILSWWVMGSLLHFANPALQQGREGIEGGWKREAGVRAGGWSHNPTVSFLMGGPGPQCHVVPGGWEEAVSTAQRRTLSIAGASVGSQGAGRRPPPPPDLPRLCLESCTACPGSFSLNRGRNTRPLMREIMGFHSPSPLCPLLFIL